MLSGPSPGREQRMLDSRANSWAAHKARLVRRLRGISPLLSDRRDHDGLYRLAEAQAGYFTAGQALAAGMDRSTLRHHARPGGRYKRVRRVLYRLRRFPTSSHEHVVAAWLPLREAGAVASHESALDLHDVSDVIPVAVHLSLPRAKPGQRPRFQPDFRHARSWLRGK